MEHKSNNDVRASFKALFFLMLGLCVLMFFLWARWWRPTPGQKSEWLVPVDGLTRGEVYFYGPSDNDIRERYNGSDEERSLVLLDGRPEEFPPYDDINNRFQGGDLYRMANEFNYKDFIEINALPEDSPIVFQYNFYYEDGTSSTVIIFPHAMSIDGILYTLDYDKDSAAMERAPLVTFWEVLFWKLSAGDWP